ncbi:MAG TPA: isocitrate lyase/PEP mutase family protein [Burkholderiales bacterium]
MATPSKGRMLRERLAQKKFLFTPGLSTPLQAMIIEKAGYDYAYMGGYDTSLTLLGMPDIGLITATEMIASARSIAGSVNIPVLADADTGYGNAINVQRTVREFEAAGVAGINIEDQVNPKRCGHVAGKQIIAFDEAVGKIRAAVEAKNDPDFIIIARTDAVAATGGGLDEAIRRGLAFARAGADMLWCEFPSTDLAGPARFATAIHAEFPGLPLYFNYSSNLKWHESPVSFDALADLGFRLITVSLAGMRVAMQAVWDYAVDLRQRGAAAEIDLEKKSLTHALGDHHAFAGFARMRELESRYLPEEDLKKYEGAQGL